ncbi:MAG TPA: hypothetical protein VNI01_10595 [Elusimicrobiota bacterium]|jgi:hypothetical protein|nr:hypothetical protein [Elusimicrobiota bacterium]
MIDKDKRWQDRRERWVAPGEVFDPAAFAVDALARDREAKAFVEAHHYSGSYPAARFRVGLFGPGARLVGVAVFSEPAQRAVVPRWTGLARDRGVELGRFVLLPEVAYNGETWFLARAFRLLREAKPVDAVVSYADPTARFDAAGRRVKPEHWGTIYQASGARYVGRARKRSLVLAPDGSVVSERAISKIRNEERGWEYAARQLLRHGAPARAAGEDLAAWCARALLGFRRLPHAGNLTYVFGLTKAGKAKLADLHGGGLPYPKAA